MRASKPKLTPATITAICEGVKLGLAPEYAAKRAGVGKRDLERWLRSGAKSAGGVQRALVDAIEEAESLGMAGLLGNVQRAARGTPSQVECPHCAGAVTVPSSPGDVRAAVMLLERFEAQASARRVAAELEGIEETPDRTPEEFCLAEIANLERMTRAAEAAGSWQAATAARRQIRQAFADLREIRKAKAEPPPADDSGLSPAELAQEEADWFRDEAPELVARAVYEVLRERFEPSGLRLVQ